MTVAVIGGGPAGLMAAEVLSQQGIAVTVYDAMPSVGRKLLMAGRGGLNLTHSEPLDTFLTRFSDRGVLASVMAFDNAAVRAWADGLGVETFIGTSGRVFPVDFKAAPLLRHWLRRLRGDGVTFRVRHRWTGWDAAGKLVFETPDGPAQVQADATILALGGGSWPSLGSTGAWVDPLTAAGIPVNPLKPANGGFECDWTPWFAERFAGQPLKPVTLTVDGVTRQGEMMITATGIEGGLVYALSAALRDRIEAEGSAVATLDLAPGRDLARLRGDLARPRGSRSMTTHLRRQTGLDALKVALLHEVSPTLPADVAGLIKALPLRVARPRPLAEAISSAGGVSFAGLDDGLMAVNRPGLFLAGEMLDWEAPTGGYLLTACLATGRTAGLAAARYLSINSIL